MTEGQWDACTDVTAMLEFLRNDGMASERKLRLFACGCCRPLWSLLTDQRSRSLLVLTERFAEGEGSTSDLEDARTGHAHVYEGGSFAVNAAANANAWSAAQDTPRQVGYATALRPGGTAYRRQPPALLRCIFGPPPFAPPHPSPSLLGWQDGIVTSLAEAAYEFRSLPSRRLDNARLGVMSDAIEDAGCTDDRLLGHLRSEGPHVRGCFALDAVRGKE